MVSQCARATTAKEAAFRVDYPNSARRAVKIVALDHRSVPIVERLVRADPRRTALLLPRPDTQAIAGDASQTVGSIKAALSDFASRTKSLIDEIDPTDLIVLVSAAGEDGQLAAVIGDACRARGVPVTALILDSGSTSDQVLAASLAKLRPYASMLVVARGDEYIEDMLAALRV